MAEPKFHIKSSCRKLLADTYTPVGVYARLREHFPVTLLLESSDYHSYENSHSFICAEPLASIILTEKELHLNVEGKSAQKIPLKKNVNIPKEIDAMLGLFRQTDKLNNAPYDGFFGYTCYDAVKYFEKIDLQSKSGNEIPLLQYHLFRYVLLFNHFNEQISLFENIVTYSEEGKTKKESAGQPERSRRVARLPSRNGSTSLTMTTHENNNLDFIEGLIKNKNFRAYPFSTNGKIDSNLSDRTFKENVTKGKQHCQRGDVFQVVMSRGFSQPFSGDDFNVYRTLRSINPSPYLFYFDFGSFRIFGSSPEAQLVIKKNMAYINPIAGTFRRTGNDERDRELAQKLLNDPKENSEHVMLVDLARNDLSVHCRNVTVEKYKDIHFYSHVIHLVSTVSGELIEPGKPFQLFSKTFPAGTLSGAPKIRAMQIIDECERTSRGYYGGAIGIIGIDGSVNQAIMIRSFLSKDNTLRYQAGAGVVIDSNPESELQEVNNKLGALKKAIEEANLIAV